MAKRGVTQELIEETRALPETQMLKEMQTVLSKGGDLEFRDPDGATPVSIQSFLAHYVFYNPFYSRFRIHVFQYLSFTLTDLIYLNVQIMDGLKILNSRKKRAY
jgi:ABC-type microcin C transport system permease subunit YejB